MTTWPWVEQRRGVKDGMAWLAVNLDGTWTVLLPRCDPSHGWTLDELESNYVATETFSPSATLAELKRLQEENARLAARCEELKATEPIMLSGFEQRLQCLEKSAVAARNDINTLANRLPPADPPSTLKKPHHC